MKRPRGMELPPIPSLMSPGYLADRASEAIAQTPGPAAGPGRGGVGWELRRAGPALAVVVPVYKHSVLLGEAVISALNQRADFGLVIVIVNDGCPMPETHQACLDFVAAAPDRVHYIRRANGGLSAARQTRLRYLLRARGSVQASYFLLARNPPLPGPPPL